MERYASALAVVLLALSTGCQTTKSTPEAEDQPALEQTLEGHWEGVYYQHDMERAYPMVVEIDVDSDNRLSVLANWKSVGARSLGEGLVSGHAMEWTELRLLGGTGILLNGRYIAEFSGDTLRGTMELEGKEEGRFRLNRVEGAAPLQYGPWDPSARPVTRADRRSRHGSDR